MSKACWELRIGSLCAAVPWLPVQSASRSLCSVVALAQLGLVEWQNLLALVTACGESPRVDLQQQLSQLQAVLKYLLGTPGVPNQHCHVQK